MKLKELCKEIVKIESSPLGDLCEDMLDDYKFPWDKSIKEMWSYLSEQRGIYITIEDCSNIEYRLINNI